LQLYAFALTKFVALFAAAPADRAFSVTAPIDQRDPDNALLAAALAGAKGAGECLTRALADLVFTACLRVTAGEAEAEAAFRETMAALSANKFARLKSYDGRARLRVYVALVVRDLLLERALRMLVCDAARGWRAFEAFFGADLKRMIERALPGPANRQNREDAYQAVSEALLQNGLQRLRAYSGRGSPTGFVLHVLENLVIDFARTIVPRRRLPAAIERSAPLDQAVFRLVYWQRLDAEPALLLPHLSRVGAPPPTVAAIAEAIARVRQALPAGYCAEPRRDGAMLELSAVDELSLAVDDLRVPTPEDNLSADEAATLLEQALGALQQILPALPAAERLYLQLALTGAPAREIARLMCLPVEEVHRLAQKLKRRLRAELGETEAVKRWRLSV
jgi:RNA polymerase primary sigma factor